MISNAINPVFLPLPFDSGPVQKGTPTDHTCRSEPSRGEGVCGPAPAGAGRRPFALWEM